MYTQRETENWVFVVSAKQTLIKSMLTLNKKKRKRARVTVELLYLINQGLLQ